MDGADFSLGSGTHSFLVVATLAGLSGDAPRVRYVGAPQDKGVMAQTLVALSPEDIGGEVAIMFAMGDRSRPVVVGRLLRSVPEASEGRGAPTRTIEHSAAPAAKGARDDLEIRCGKASITLTPSGKIILRGTYISTRSSGVVRIKGGSVQIN